MNGNGPLQKGVPGRAGLHPPRLQARQLQEVQLAKDLRADGWELPASVKPGDAVRVYDTRLEDAWLTALIADMRGTGEQREVVRVGGDFITAPAIEDSVALHPDRMRRWGPHGPCHIVVPPRPHLRTWAERLQLQVDMEDAGTVFTMFCVAERDRCPAVIDRPAALRMLPQAAAILEDDRLEVQVVAVGERAPVVRVPAEVRRLPPPKWEPGLLARNRVLVALHFHKVREPVAMTAKWVRGNLPAPEPSGLELLRFEYEGGPEGAAESRGRCGRGDDERPPAAAGAGGARRGVWAAGGPPLRGGTLVAGEWVPRGVLASVLDQGDLTGAEPGQVQPAVASRTS